jgi:hypothetical protein
MMSNPAPLAGEAAAGSIDWRFADPLADVVMGINFGHLSASPLARAVIAQLAARQALTDADVKKIFDGLAGVDQIGVSLKDNRMVVMFTGGVSQMGLPAPQPGMKTLPISGALLFGSTEAVDQAAQRINAKGALSELVQSAAERQASAEFWAVGSARAAGQLAIDAGVKRFWLTFSARERLTGEMAFECSGPPSAKTVEVLAVPGAAIEGNVVHSTMSMEPGEVRQKFGEVVASPVGDRLATMVGAARQLPTSDVSVLKQTRPVIYGLDSGPKVVGQP